MRATWLLAGLLFLAGCMPSIIYSLARDAPQEDTVTLASCLSESGVTFYGASWCSHCDEQKRLFGDSGKYLRYVECALPDGTQAPACAGIEGYPTWEFADGSRVAGVLSLEQLGELSGCGSAPLTFSGPGETLWASEGEEFSYALCGAEEECLGEYGDPSGGLPPYSFGSSGLPAGLELLPNGLLFGAPVQAGEYSVPVCVADAAGAVACQVLTLVVGGLESRGCSVDTDCLAEEFCEGGLCALPDMGCSADADCVLLDWQYRVPCCYAGQCGGVDYGKASVIAVSGEWLAQMRALYCPPPRQCGPAPGCPAMIVDVNYHAECVYGACEKIPGES
ncbi:hypothetical protein J4439_02400 [Candidatus Woesearchaeota archaeon]|nr:hypothetical protein [Candidatus Woesearchaeota archaeon]